MSDQVCHIPTNKASSQLQQPNQVKLPIISPANDLPSAIAAINQIRLVLQLITGQTPTQKPGDNVPSNIATVSTSGQNPLNPLGPSTGTPKKARFSEVKADRVVNTITVENGKFARVDQVIFQDNVTGELIVWKR